MSEIRKAILITVDGNWEVISWDNGDDVTAVREALSGVPALIPAEVGYAMFGRDPEIHPQGEVNVLATFLNQICSEEGRVYVFGDVVIANRTEDGDPEGFHPSQQFMLKYLADSKDGLLRRLTRSLDENPKTIASIKKLEDVRPEEEKEAVPE